MKKMTLKMPRIDARAMAWAFAGLAVAAMITAWARTAQYDRTANTLSGIYQKAFYETCELAESMTVNLSKLSVASRGARENLLSDIISQAQGAQANLALLPLSSSATGATMKFINQVGDFSGSMLGVLASGGEISEEDFSTITTLSESAAQLTLDLGRLMERYDAGDVTFEGVLTDEGSLSPITDPASAYPALLYDGPFSDGAKGNDFRHLEGLENVSAQEAERLLKEFIGAETVTEMRLDGESTLPTPTYEFTVMAGRREMSASVTKKGGRVLYLLSSGGAEEARLSVEECIRRADTFLLSRGYEDMVMNYHTVYGNSVTINYAAQQGGVVMYPDLVKIQISMEDGSLMGIEAGNFLRNNRERQLELPAITESDALARISPHLTADGAKLCVIPYGTGEKMCYEIRAEAAEGSYLIYIDAMTGEEAEIMQIIENGGGTLVM